MRRLGVLAGFCAAAFAMSVIAPSAASARVETFKLTTKPFLLQGFQTIFPKVVVPTPRRTGYITRMDAHLVDQRGKRVSIRNVMLHHIVFITSGAKKNGSCPGRGGEPFWGTGEERQPLKLPEGYGYKIAAKDSWRMQTMLMSHSLKAHRVRVAYTVRMIVGLAAQARQAAVAAGQRLLEASELRHRGRPAARIGPHQAVAVADAAQRPDRRGERAPARQLVRAEGHAAALQGPPADRPEAALWLRRRHRLPRETGAARAGADRDRDVPVEGRHPRAQGRDAQGRRLLLRRPAAPAGHGDHPRLHRGRWRRAARVQPAAQGRPHLLDAQRRPL